MQPGDDRLVAEALLYHLGKSYSYLGPVMMTASIILGYASLLVPQGDRTLTVPLAVSIGVVGGYFEFHTLLVLQRLRDLAWGRPPSLLGYVGRAAVLTGLYYTVIGSLLIASQLKSLVEHLTGRPIEDSYCTRYYNPLFILVSLGAGLTPLQACISKSASSLIPAQHILPHENPERLSPQA